MANPLTVDDLIQIVRDDIDEANLSDVENSEILKKLNRAQRQAVNKVVTDYDEMFLATTTVTLTAGTAEYDMPSDIYGQRLEKVQQIIDDRPYRVDRVTYRQSDDFERLSTSTRLRRYAIKHNKYVLYPTPSSNLTIRLWYMRNPETLVTQQGRVTSSGTDGSTGKPYVIVSGIGSDITTSSSSLNNYVNIIDSATGRVKGSLQIASINTSTGQILFKDSSLTRSSVLGKTISTSLPSDLAVDDYICTVHGTCVTEFPQAYVDYITQHAVVSIKRAKGEPTQEDYAELKNQEAGLESYWDGREASMRVTRRNPYLARRTIRRR